MPRHAKLCTTLRFAIFFMHKIEHERMGLKPECEHS